MKQTKGSPLGWYTVGIVALFFAGFLLLVLFGALTYRNTARSRSDNYDARSLTAYLTTAVRANDSENSVQIGDSAYGTVLSVTDGDSGFAFRIYRYNGHLVEEYEESGAELSPDSAQIIGDTTVFSAEWLTSDLLAVRTDAGRALIGVRSSDREGGSGR